MYYKFVGLVLALCAVAYGLPSAYDTENVWVAGNLSYPFPSNAILGGFDPYGYKIYVGRVKYSSDILPARVVAETGTANFNTDYTSSKAFLYDLLVSTGNNTYGWARSFDGFYEKNAVSVGTSAKSEPTYICRAKTDGGIIFGTLYLTKKLCYIKSDTLSMRTFDKYEVLIKE
ncbi:uncharacterized protein Dwil_GK20578 [Drosophila willistoni]|uniref:GK20578 n=2 Tax=Drosophila willistoni TaxID=7260 RepID=B4N5H1_DROWI|nr:uncharacterized protein Dwil_GK20578 [Drosophila willistoni]